MPTAPTHWILALLTVVASIAVAWVADSNREAAATCQQDLSEDVCLYHLR